jgi:peroxiredoxin
MRLVSTLVLASGLLSGTFAVPGLADNAPAEKIGLKIGMKAPAFTLKDQSGKERSLDDFLKKGTLAVVFYRSASWSPFCQKQLVQLQADLKDIEAAGCHIAGVSYDSVEILARFAEKEKITFPLLADPGSKTITAYGLLNTEAKDKAEGIAYPVTMLIDRKGVISAKLFLDGYRDRHSKELLLKAVAAIKGG